MNIDEVKQYLSQYYYLSQKIDSLKEEYQCLEVLADGTQGINYEPKAHMQPSGKAPFIRYLDKLEKKRRQIDEKIEELLGLKEEIEEAIATVDDPVMELVLTYRYINCYDWIDIAKKLHYTESYLFKLHRKALSLVKIKDDSKRQ